MKKIPDDYCKPGHIRPVAFVREIHEGVVYIKETKMTAADIPSFIEWLHDALRWCGGVSDKLPLQSEETTELSQLPVKKNTTKHNRTTQNLKS